MDNVQSDVPSARVICLMPGDNHAWYVRYTSIPPSRDVEHWFKSIEDAADFMEKAGVSNDNIDAAIVAIHISDLKDPIAMFDNNIFTKVVAG